MGRGVGLGGYRGLEVMKRAFILFLMLLPIQALAVNVPVTYAVRNSVGETIMYAPTTTYTKTLTVANPELPFVTNSMEITTAAVVADKLQRLGFRPDDPRVGLTIDAIQKEAISTATGAAGAGFTGAAVAVLTGAALGTPVGWGVIGASALVGLVGYGIQKLVTGGLDWLFNSDGTVSIGSGGEPALIEGASVFYTGHANCAGQAWGSTPVAVGLGCAALSEATWGSGGPDYSVISCDSSICNMVRGAPYYLEFTIPIYSSTAPAGSSCPSGTYAPGAGGCISSSGTTVSSSPGVAIAAMPDSERVLPVTDKAISSLIDALWRSAYARDSSIMPPQSIGESDVSAIRANNPAVSPVGDNLGSAPGSFSPTVSPINPSPSAPGASVNPGTGGLVGPGIPSPSAPAPTAATPRVDLGVDPNIGAPSLEATPTAQQILNPILNLFPDLKSFVVPSHASVCPAPSMSLFDKSLVLDGHCTLLETVRPTLYAVMAFVWVVIGLFIILAA